MNIHNLSGLKAESGEVRGEHGDRVLRAGGFAQSPRIEPPCSCNSKKGFRGVVHSGRDMFSPFLSFRVVRHYHSTGTRPLKLHDAFKGNHAPGKLLLRNSLAGHCSPSYFENRVSSAMHRGADTFSPFLSLHTSFANIVLFRLSFACRA